MPVFNLLIIKEFVVLDGNIVEHCRFCDMTTLIKQAICIINSKVEKMVADKRLDKPNSRRGTKILHLPQERHSE